MFPFPTPTEADTDLAQQNQQAERRAYQRTSKLLWLFMGITAVVALVVGWLTSGLPGVWGALIGAGLAAMFCGGTMWSVTKTVGSAPISMAATVMLTWLAKLIVLIVVLAALRGRDFYNPYVLFAVIAVTVIGALAVQAISIKRNKVPYITPKS